jgi:hypothetical protein
MKTFCSPALALPARISFLFSASEFLRPLARAEFRSAIERRATSTGLSVDPAIVDQLVEDAGSEPGDLPLLEFVLRQLRHRHEFTSNSYRSTGGSHAESSDYANEALVRYWDLLRTLLSDNRQFLLWRQRFKVRLEEWESHSWHLKREILDDPSGLLQRVHPCCDLQVRSSIRRIEICPHTKFHQLINASPVSAAAARCAAEQNENSAAMNHGALFFNRFVTCAAFFAVFHSVFGIVLCNPGVFI